ncbi:MAG: ABC transporter permease, partial [Dongiaceae bacterium]
MTRYLIRRGIGAVIVMWAVATLVFFMVRIIPGDPIAAMLFDTADAEAVAAQRHKLGLDAPVYVQYVKWFWLMFQGDLGNSLYGSHIPISQAIIEALPRTLSLAGLGFVIALAIAVPAGLIAATRRNSMLDT